VAFNSYSFALLFLPLIWLAYRLAAWFGARRARLMVLIAAGAVFCATACAWALPVLLASLLGSFTIAQLISASEGRIGPRWLMLGISANVLVLVVYKFTGFLRENLALVKSNRDYYELPARDIIAAYPEITLIVLSDDGFMVNSHPMFAEAARR